MEKPDLIIIPNSGVNRNVPDLNAAYCGTAWRIPVLDLNSDDSEIGLLRSIRLRFQHPKSIAISVRNFSTDLAKDLEARISHLIPDCRIGSLSGPLDVLCCYRYEQFKVDFKADLEFGDALPFPDFSLFSSSLSLRWHWFRGQPYTIMSSLGCPFGCTYCMARARKWRPRSSANCIAELKGAIARWRIRSFQIIDDCFNYNGERLLEFCELVRPLNLSWYCCNGLRADRMDALQAKALVSSGCHHVSFGIETSDPALLTSINKGEGIEAIAASIAVAKEAGLSVAGFFLIGLPGSSYEKDLASIEWARSHGILSHFSYFVPASFWQEGGKQFWGATSAPLSDAYPKELQRLVYEKAWSKQQ